MCFYYDKDDFSVLKTPFSCNIGICRLISLPSWKYDNALYAFWLLYWNPENEVELTQDHETMRIPPDRIALIPPYTRFSCCSRQPLKHFHVHFDVASPFDRVQRRILTFPAGGVRNFFLALHRARDKARCPLLLHRMIYDYLAMIPESLFLPSGSGVISPGIRRVVDFMNSDMKKIASNRKLARIAGLSINTFYKSFLKEIGVTPHHYLLNMRMEFARNRLIYTEDAIDAIAEEAGFSDRFHFSKVFKYVNAISPAAYRKLNRKEPGA